MPHGITIKILGDYGPFSKVGKSVGYKITIGQSTYLLDCGAPIFQQISGPRLKTIQGLIISHCHDDHKRWLTDLALFNRYSSPSERHKVVLFTSETINEELVRASGPALDRSLSADSKTVIDIAYEDYIDFKIIGPRAKYKISSKDDGNGKSYLCVTDRAGNPVGPDMAKIIISRATGRPRLLFRDPEHKEWIEPESFYPFSSEIFYEQEQNIYMDTEGFTIEALNSCVWHGISNIGFRIKTKEETLIFSSDTVHNKHLWEQLYSEKKNQQLDMSKEEFASARIIYGDINAYIERTWSRERYLDAINSFKDAFVIHDIALKDSVVHTDYRKLADTFLHKKKVILTHSPDILISEWILSRAEKSYEINNKDFFEVVGDKLYPLNADIYYKKSSKYYVGYKNENGKYAVYEENDILHISKIDKIGSHVVLYRIDLFEDIAGQYFPKLEDLHTEYQERSDGKIELITFSPEGSLGRVVECQRDKLCKSKGYSSSGN